MSFRVVRESKFRNIFGTPWKREQCYDNIRVSKSSWDSTMCAVNLKFLAVIVESAGGGAFIVFPLSKTGRIPIDFPLVGGHKGPVLDIAWCPHNDNIIASASEDCLVRVWQIPDLPLSRTLTEPLIELDYHQRRVGQVLWHPSARNVLLSVGSDNLAVVWDIGTATTLTVISCHTDIIYSACWNYNGSQIVTTCKDKKVRIINPRDGQVISEGICHEGTKASRAIFLKTGLIFTTGFSKMSERQFSLRSPEMLSEPIVMTEIDTSNGLMFPIYDPDHNLVYLCGKGDSVIRYYEVTSQVPYVHYISQFLTQDPQRGVGIMPKRGLNTASNEIARFYRLTNSGYCQVVSISVPRKSERYQEDLYPDTAAEDAAISAQDWFQGKDADPLLVAMTEVQQQLPTKKTDLKMSRRAISGLEKHTSSNCSNEVNASESSSQQYVTVEKFTKLEEEIRKLKAVIVKHENRLRAVEAELAQTKLEKAQANDDVTGATGPGLDPDEV